MSNILCLGGYSPKMSINSCRNHLVACEMREKRHDVYLVSDSWCDAKSYNFVDCLSNEDSSYPFKKKFFVDPLQIVYSGGNSFVGVLSLLYKLCDNEQIDCVYISDLVSYGLVGELIKNNLKIPTILGQFSDNTLMLPYETYIKDCFKYSLHMFDKVYTYPWFVKQLLKMDSSVTYYECIPISWIKNGKSNLCTQEKYEQSRIEYIVGELNNVNDVAAICAKITDIANDGVLHLCLFGKERDNVYEKLYGNKKIEIFYPDSIDSAINFILRGSIVLDIKNLLTIERNNFDAMFMLYACGYLPVISKSMSKYLSVWHEAEIINITGSYCVLKNIKLDTWNSICDGIGV